jgi:C-terminal processing protease CtpA/Prc
VHTANTAGYLRENMLARSQRFQVHSNSLIDGWAADTTCRRDRDQIIKIHHQSMAAAELW